MRSAIEQRCGDAAKVQRCRVHKIRNIVERLPKDNAYQVRRVMTQAFKLDASKGKNKLKELAKQLQAQHPHAAASMIEGLDEMFTITELGITGELARCLGTPNVIESPNLVVRRVSGRVTNYKDVAMALRWTAARFLEAEKSFRRLRGYAQMKTLINALRPNAQQLKPATEFGTSPRRKARIIHPCGLLLARAARREDVHDRRHRFFHGCGGDREGGNGKRQRQVGRPAPSSPPLRVGRSGFPGLIVLLRHLTRETPTTGRARP